MVKVLLWIIQTFFSQQTINSYTYAEHTRVGICNIYLVKKKTSYKHNKMIENIFIMGGKCQDKEGAFEWFPQNMNKQ